MATAELGACEWFVYELRRSNLIERGQLEQVVNDFLRLNPRADAAALAHSLVEQRVLSQFQADRVLANKAQGLVLGPYVLVDVLGTGSMGTVFKAQSKSDQHFYAVKILPRRSMWNVRLARRQVRQFGQFSHPAVAPFVDVGTSGGTHYLVWPLIEGEPLEALVQRQAKLPANVTAQIGWQIANALNVCHQNGIFHGLLKPSNVMIGAQNHVTVLDFGIGSLLAENEGESLVDTMSTANTLTSGLDCCSPESIMEPSNRTLAGDQYSLGCTLYFCLTGRYPFAEGSAVEKMMAHQFKDPTPLKEVVPDVPDRLAEVVGRLMKKNPDERYRGFDEVVEDLQPLVGEAAATLPGRASGKHSAKMALSALRDRTTRRAQANGPPSSPYPAPANYPAPGHRSGKASPDRAEQSRGAPGRDGQHSPDGSNSGQPGYAMPPGFVAEAQQKGQFSPVFYTVLGMSVMAFTYMALVYFKPFG